MEIISKDELKLNREKYIESIKSGAIFIYPTDTIYGMGCIATKSRPVEKVRKLKNREIMPFSVIVPSKDWIRKNCIIPKGGDSWIEKLPGPYTLIFKLKNKESIAKEVNNGWDTLGVRIPKHWISRAVELLGQPVITTSVNLSGEEFMTSLDNLNQSIKNGVDFIVYEGEKKGNPSTIVNLSKDKIEIITRGKQLPEGNKWRESPIRSLIKKIVKK
ncbi:MAG: L-threonylcarbamoyladenylate synthase [Candidatus Woesearchaeota archaeon]|nr:L-threonylcarbamoyladenylate synthase [Candidatus Woesearchaeota archaeon]